MSDLIWVILYIACAAVVGTVAYRDMLKEWQERTLMWGQVVMALLCTFTPMVNLATVVLWTPGFLIRVRKRPRKLSRLENNFHQPQK